MADRDSRDLKVLLVEDVEDMRLALEDQGFIVLEAEDGQSAVATAVRDTPDVILMDLSLPLMDGFAAAKLMRQTHEPKNVPIIAVTASPKNEIIGEIMSCGMNDFVSKPFKPNELRNKILEYL